MVAGGTAAAQAITVLASPIITRLYGPEAFGVLGVFTSAVTVLTPVSMLAYGYAVAVPADDREALALIRAAMIIRAVFLAAGLAVFTIARSPVARLLSWEANQRWLFLIPLATVAMGIQMTHIQWLARKRRFGPISGLSIGHAVATNAAKIGIGIVAPLANTLVIIAAAGSALHGTAAWFFAQRTGVQPTHARISLREAAAAASTYRDFAMFRAPQLTLNAISRNAPTILFAVFFGPAVAGFYALGQRVLQLPSTVISQSLAKVLLPYMADAHHQRKNLRTIIVHQTIVLALIGTIPYGLIVVFGPRLFTWAFGAQWTVAGEYARWLSLWLFFGFINVPAVQSFAVRLDQKFVFFWEGLATAAKLAVIVIAGIWVRDSEFAVRYYSIVGAVTYTVLIIRAATRSDYSNTVAG